MNIERVEKEKVGDSAKEKDIRKRGKNGSNSLEQGRLSPPPSI